MRVFYAVGDQPGRALVGSEVWRRNLHDALVEMGCDVVDLQYDLGGFYRYANPAASGASDFLEHERPRLEVALLEQIEAAHRHRPIDLFFSYFYSAFVDPSVIRSIGDMGITTVNWYCNASYQFELVRDIASAYSFCLVPEKFRLADYRSAGANPIYCQEAANPAFYAPLDVPRDLSVTFVGAAYGDRPDYVRALTDAGVQVHAWGPGWLDLSDSLSLRARARRFALDVKGRVQGRVSRTPLIPAWACGGPLDDLEMVKVFSRAKISLGFSSVGGTASSSAPIHQVRLRDFEAPMAGAFYLLEYVEEIEEFFVIDKEIVCFADADELLSKTSYYLAHPEKRETIRIAGHERALRDHTWQRRLADAFAAMGVSL